MDLYRIVLAAESSLWLKDRVHRIEFVGPSVTVSAIQSGSTLASLGHAGVAFDVRLESASFDEAIAAAGRAARAACDLLTAAHAAAVEDPSVVLAYDISSGETTRMRQFIDAPAWSQKPRRRFREDHLEDLVSGLNRVADEGTSLRLQRALRMIRRATLDSDPLDQFLDLWLALEALNPLLEDRFDLDGWYVARSCELCGAPQQVKGGSAGARHAVIELARRGKVKWKELRNLRLDIVHARRDPEQIISDLGGAYEEMFNIVLQALTELVEIGEEVSAKYLRYALPILTGPEFCVHATLGMPPENLTPDIAVLPHFRPSFEPEPVVKESEIDVVTQKVHMRLEKENWAGPVLKCEVIGWTRFDPEDPSTSFNVSPRLERESSHEV